MPLRRQKSWFGVAIDAPDARTLARFYQRLLDWPVLEEDADDPAPTWVTLRPSTDAGYNLAFQTETRFVRPVWPAGEGDQQMQVHLDLEVDDLDEAVAHALACGAELPAFQPQHDVRVMLDPVGHPFCLYLG